MKKFAVIVAAGSGSRMKSAVPKQFMELNGKPVLWYTLNTFLKSYSDLIIILVLPPESMEHGLAIAQAIKDSTRIKITGGGDTRFQSVKNGLALTEDDSIVFVHDAVRCLVTTELIHRCYDAAVANGNAIPAINATDTIRIDRGNGPEPFDRNKVFVIQTPQTFRAKQLKDAYNRSYNEAFTDEATVAEASGLKIHLVEGETTNIKLTRPADLVLARSIIGQG
ncbi:MAG TPA: 2-C-methyl-D-erythritol 4-phosphate cytidylyltransferase [Chitinophagaceae bacterium]